MTSISGRTYKVSWTRKSTATLRNIHRYVTEVKQEPQSANELYLALWKFGNELGTKPKGYPRLDDQKEASQQYFQAVYKKNYVFIFRLDERKHMLYITNVHHAAQHPSKRLK